MPNTRFDFKTNDASRFLTSLLILALASSPLSYARQRPQPQQRILTQEERKTDASQSTPTAPRVAPPELVLQTGVTRPAVNSAFSPDGRLLASVDFMAGSIKLWEVATGRELCAINLGERAQHTHGFNSAFAFNSDGSSLFSVSAGILKQWDTRTGRQIRAADLNRGKDFGHAYFNNDARLLATTTLAGSSLTVWDVASGRKLHELKMAGHDEDESQAQSAPQARPRTVKPETLNYERLLAFALSPDGRTLATDVDSEAGGVKQEVLALRDAASGRVTRSIKISERRNAPGSYFDQNRAIRLTPDGRGVAVAFHDTTRQPAQFSGGQERITGRINKVRMWDVSSGREIISFDAGGQSPGTFIPDLNFGMTNTFALSNDNRQCAVAIGAAIRLFDPATGRNLANIGGHASDVVTVSYSADGKLLATASLDSTIKIWNAHMAAVTGRAELERTLSGMATPVASAAFSDDGRALAVSGANAVNVWELNTGAALRTIMRKTVTQDLGDLTHSSPSVFSAGGRFIVAQDGVNEIKLWETRTGREVKNFPLSQGKKFVGAGVSPNGKWVALAEDRLDPNSILGKANPSSSTDQPQAPQSALNFPQFPAAPEPSTPPESTGDPKKDEKERRKEEKERRKEMEKRQKEILEQMSRGGKKNRKGQPQTPMGGLDLAELQKRAEEANRAAESGDLGKVMEIMSQMMGDSGAIIPGMSVFQPGVNVRLWDVNAANEPRSLHKQMNSLFAGPASVSAMAFNNDGSLLASAEGVRSIKINETASGRISLTFTPERALSVDSLAWSPDGRLLASSITRTREGVNLNTLAGGDAFSGLFDYSIKLWDAAAGRELRTLSGHTAKINATTFSPDGRLLASGGIDAVVRLWDSATGREVAALKGHALSVNALAFSDDGKLLVSGADDGSARLWDVRSGETLATLVTLNGGADWLVVTPNGLFDGTPGAWGQILWRFNPDNIFDVAPVEIFFNEFFHPGLLADIASGKRPKAARNVELKDRRQPILKLARADNAAGRSIRLKIDVSEPESPDRASPAGARDVRLFRNGTLVKVWRGDALKGRKQATLEAEIPIIAGENRILAYAFNSDGVKSSDAVLAVAGDESLRRKGVAYVIACGVNQYANSQYNLKYAVADATSFAEEIRAQQMKLREYERVEIIPLLDKDATKANILLALNLLSNATVTIPAGAPPALSKIRSAQPEDAVLMFFAGHGAARGSRFYLIPHDLGYAGARDALSAEAVKTILSHGVSDLELESAIEGVDAGRMLFVIDACNSGQALEAEEKRRGPMNSSGLAQLAYEKGLYILTAAQSFQAALEAAQLGHGYLTFALIEDGLKKGQSDRDPKDGQTLAREWFNYAEERVPQMQEREMQTRLILNFAPNEAKEPGQRDVQRPRVFYRRELEAHPFVIAKP